MGWIDSGGFRVDIDPSKGVYRFRVNFHGTEHTAKDYLAETVSKTDLLGTVAIETVESTLEAVTSDEMAAALAEVEDVDVAVEDLTIVSQCDFTAEEYPVVVKFFGEGTEDVTICMFVKYENADKWTLLYHGLAGEWEVEFEAAGTYAIAVVAD